jgi:hypothetical protein
MFALYSLSFGSLAAMFAVALADTYLQGTLPHSATCRGPGRFALGLVSATLRGLYQAAKTL